MSGTQTLAPPQFVDTNVADLTGQLVTQYQTLTAKPLLPAQYERMFIDLCAYLGSLQLMSLQQACQQMLVRFAAYPALDFLGDLVGVSRAGATGALTTLAFQIAPGLLTPNVIPAGFQVGSTDGLNTFATTQAVVIPVGITSITAPAMDLNTGTVGNGYQPGDISVLVSTLPGIVLSASNTTPTASGTDPETDDELRQLILDAPETFSVAGPAGAYEALAMAVRDDIIAVKAVCLSSGIVTVYPLLATGLPGPDLLALVLAALSPETVRPLCDTVRVLAPVQAPYTISAQVTVYNTADPAATMAAVQVAANSYVQGRAAGLKMDLIGSQIVAALSVPGVYSLALTGWTDQILSPWQWACCTGLNLTLVGVGGG